MRKVVSWVLLFLGAFLLATAVIAKFWAPDVAKRTPLDTDSVTHLSGEAAYVTRVEGEPTDNVAMRATSFNAVDSEKSTDDEAVFKSYTCLVTDEAEGDCGLEGEGKDADPNVINISDPDFFVTDRRTAEAVDQADFDLPEGAVQHEGLVNKFPFDVEKKDYPFWDGMLKKAVTATYEGEESLDGLKTYKFNYSVSEEPAEVSKGIDGLYSMDKTMWVDQVTGSIVDQEQHEVRSDKKGDPLLDIELSFTDDQVKGNIDDAKDNGDRLNLITGTVPLLGFILGPLLIIVGLVLLLRGGSNGNRRREETQPTDDQGVSLGKH